MEPTEPTVGQPWGDAATPYLEIGGEDRVRALAHAFYDRIETESPALRLMLPRTTAGSRDKLFEFLSGWMGGPQPYVAKRGHPRLRMRHFPFAIGPAEVQEWLRCMSLALDDVGVDGRLRQFLEDRFTASAHHMRNQ
jgi:hemoglobin